MRYTYSVVHVPGKSLWTANTLLHLSVKLRMSTEEQELMETTNIYVDCVMESLPVSPTDIENLREQLKADSVCSHVMTLCTEEWPAHAKQEPVLKSYWPERATLTVKDGLLLKKTWLLIPSAMRNDVLAKLHKGHQGVVLSSLCGGLDLAGKLTKWSSTAGHAYKSDKITKGYSRHQNALKDHGKSWGWTSLFREEKLICLSSIISPGMLIFVIFVIFLRIGSDTLPAARGFKQNGQSRP